MVGQTELDSFITVETDVGLHSTWHNYFEQVIKYSPLFSEQQGLQQRKY